MKKEYPNITKIGPLNKDKIISIVSPAIKMNTFRKKIKLIINKEKIKSDKVNKLINKKYKKMIQINIIKVMNNQKNLKLLLRIKIYNMIYRIH